MPIIYEKKNGIATITINRPEVLNSIDPETDIEMKAAFADAGSDADVLVIILTGSGDRAFCVGLDIKKYVPLLTSKTRIQAREDYLEHENSWQALANVRKPVIAAINGLALGGGVELILACDIRIASENSSFGLPECTLGLLPGAGGTQRLPRLIGLGKAMEIILTGESINADEALKIGLVNKVIPSSDLMESVTHTAEKICKAGPVAVRYAKEAMIKGLDLPLPRGLELEQSLAQILQLTEDSKEGARAFAEKRSPEFKGR